MLLKSIKLENFRQFRNESIDFAQGEGGKNVTIIIGENGTGKTTFAQAFFWCLYGETEFSDKIILNKMVATEMTPGSEEKVRVTLALRHGEVDYTLIREQAYHKDYANNVKGDNTVFDIAIKDTSGNTSYVKKSQCEAEVKSILPKELSRYFFFDGERIEKMSKDISTGKKATDFAEAVKGLLGLNAMINEIQPNVFQNINPDAFYWNDGIYEEIEQRALREILEKLMGELSEREQAVLIARYGFEDGVEKTLEEVGQTFGVTRERIRQIESKALRKLSHPTRIRELKDFL